MSATAWMAVGFVLAVWAAFCWLGAYVAGAKRRSRAEGFWLGFCLGIFGVLIEALLPTKPEPRKAKRRDTVDHYGWKPMNEEEETVGDWIAKPSS